MRLTLAALLASATLMSAPVQAEMTETERQAFRDEVRAYLLENPEVIVEAMDGLQSREQADAALQDRQMLAEQHDAIFNDAASWSGGNPNGDITVVEFMDYRCSYCRKASADIEELVKSDGNIRFVLKEFPILGEASLISARFAIAVLQLHGADAYKTVHDKLMFLRGEPDEATLARLAQEVGFDPAAISALMPTDAVTDVIKANHALADIMEISGTPTFVVDGTMVRGYVPLEGMRQIVADERG
jgi:protein-disulfide isomerase